MSIHLSSHLLLGQGISGQRLNRIKVQELVDGVEFSSDGLDCLLADNAPKDGCHGGQVARGCPGHALQYSLIQLHGLTIVGSRNLLGCGDKLVCISLVIRRRKTAMLYLQVQACMAFSVYNRAIGEG